MKKQINLYTTIILPRIVVIIITIIAASYSVLAQNAPKFNVGDRVECDATGSRTYWDKGTVVAFKDGDMYNGYGPESGYFYRVRLDKIADVPEGYLVKASDMRPLAEAKPAQNQNGEKNERNARPKEAVKNNQNETDNENGDKQNFIKTPEGRNCEIITDVKTGGTASAALFKAIIKAQYDKQAPPGSDGAVCLEFNSFQMGAPQRWQPQNDPRRVGTDRLGTKPKMIYPVKANFTVTTQYNSAWEITEWTGTVFTCFKDEAFGNWKCRGEQGFDWQYKNKRIEK